MDYNYNILEDLFSESFVSSSRKFQKYLTESNQIPLIVFDGENSFFKIKIQNKNIEDKILFIYLKASAVSSCSRFQLLTISSLVF